MIFLTERIILDKIDYWLFSYCLHYFTNSHWVFVSHKYRLFNDTQMIAPQACRHTPYTFHSLDLWLAQNLKSLYDESKDRNNDDKFEAFAEKLDS